MKRIFPINMKIGQIQGIISILKEFDGSMSLQELSDESFLQVDDIVNILEACKTLGILKVKKQYITLDKKLINKSQHEISVKIRDRITRIEPFSQIKRNIKKMNGISTTELFHSLIDKGLINYRDNMLGIESFKKDLLITGLRLGILSYDHENDIWKLATKKD